METKFTYYLGLDMGTDSLGWAVTDSSYHILRAKGKDLWGVRLFPAAETSVDRRTYRVNRRRRQREVARIGALKELFADEIEKVDPGFFVRLDESKFHMEDRSENNKQKYGLFADKLFSDAEYYKKYPTIFHLRKELLESEEPHDVRLVYLALLNMFKHRGHFLNSSLQIEGENSNIAESYQMFVDTLKDEELDFPEQVSGERLQEIFRSSDSRKKKVENLLAEMNLSKKQKREIQFVNLICGLKGKLSELFPDKEYDEEQKKIIFTHNPFSMPQGGLEALTTKDPLELLAYQYDIVCNGVELSSGAVRNHNLDIMVKAFEIAGYTEEDLKEKFGALYNAFQYGAPPHAGMAPGVDRMIMLLRNEENIREVIPFPMNGNAQDVMCGAPNEVSEMQLREVHIKVRK